MMDRGTPTVDTYKQNATTTPVNPWNIYMTRPDGTADTATDTTHFPRHAADNQESETLRRTD